MRFGQLIELIERCSVIFTSVPKLNRLYFACHSAIEGKERGQGVLVSHKHKFIYLKTFKTAGTSVEMAIEHACRPAGAACDGSYSNGPDGIVAERGGREGRNPYRSHANARYVRRQVGEDIWERYTKVANIRNPYEKAVSMFWHQHARSALIADASDPSSAINDFRAWINASARLPRDHLRVAIGGSIAIDVAVRYECLSTDLAALGQRLGFRPAPLQHFHGGMRQLKLDHRAYYDAKTAERVAAHYALDFEAFGYDLEDWRCPSSTKRGKFAA